jgi:ferritin
MPGIAVSPAVVTELQRQLNHEWIASHSYEAMALWCENQNYKGFASFFRKQAGEEREHARRIMGHLLDRGVLPHLVDLKAPRGGFQNALEVATHAQSQERSNTVGVNAAFEAAVREKDYPAQIMLQWFVNEQVEEENWADELVDRVARAQCAGGIAELDRHIDRYLSQPSEGE